MFRYLKLALHFSHLRLGEIDPLIFELLREDDRRRREVPIKTEDSLESVTQNTEIREAA